MFSIRTLSLYALFALTLFTMSPLSAFRGSGIDRSDYRAPIDIRTGDDSTQLQYYRGYGPNYRYINRYDRYGNYNYNTPGYYNGYYTPYYNNSYYLPPPSYDQAFPDEAESNALYNQLRSQ